MSNTNNNSSSEKLGMPNHYLTLDTLPGASQNEIHHAYKRAKMTYSSGSLAAYSILEDENNEHIMGQIELAYEILSNPAHRREYDIKMGFNTWNEEQSAKAESHNYVRPSVTSHDEDSSSDNPFGEISYGTESSTSSAASQPKATTVSKTEDARRSHVRVVTETPEDDFRFVANPDFESKIETCEHIDGAFMRAVRIYKQITVEQLAARSKISPSKITAIEEEELLNVYDQPVYLRGHVSIICRVLSIPNADELSKRFVDRLKEEGKVPRPTL